MVGTSLGTAPRRRRRVTRPAVLSWVRGMRTRHPTSALRSNQSSRSRCSTTSPMTTNPPRRVVAESAASLKVMTTVC